MSANNMSDEELDKLFRESAEHYEPPFDEEAWRAMDRRLDGAQGGWAGMKRYLPLLLLALVVTVAIVWNPAKDTTVPETAHVAATGEIKVAGRAADERSTPAYAAYPEHAPTPEPASPTAPHPAAQTGSGAAAQRRQASVGRPADLPVAGVVTLEEPLPSVQTLLPTPGLPATLAAVSVVSTGEAGPLPVAAMPADSGQSGEREARVFLRSARVNLVVAPDMTTVRFRDPDAVSANAGVLFSVPITNRLSLVSGAVWANKLYNATAADYKPSPDYWDGKRLPDVIAAQCRVLDIPVNLQYRVYGRGRNTLSVQAGLSSYLMLKEDYTYTYTYPGREPYTKTREFANENRHWFGIQNLSVGYTRQLSPTLSVGAEPFVKIPLTSIGEGRVRLTSAGVFFMVGYTLK